MKKNKNEYSLTAKERKLRRMAAREKLSDKPTKEETPPEEPLQTGETEAVAEAVAEQKKTLGKKNVWILCSALGLGLVLILLAILLPFLIKNTDSRYPRAVIKLDVGGVERKIEMVIWEDDCPIAATNFIFLSKIGFFDNTILYDVRKENNYIRMGSIKSYAKPGGKNDSKFYDESFMAGIPQSMFNVVRLEDIDNSTYVANSKKNKFGYQLYKDVSADASRYKEQYVVSYHRVNSAEFVINLGENNTNYGFTSRPDTELSAFGYIEDEDSRRVLQDILALPANTATDTGGSMVGTEPSVKIKSVTVSNLNKKKWKNFEFISYMNTAYKSSDDAAPRPAYSGWST